MSVKYIHLSHQTKSIFVWWTIFTSTTEEYVQLMCVHCAGVCVCAQSLCLCECACMCVYILYECVCMCACVCVCEHVTADFRGHLYF